MKITGLILLDEIAGAIPQAIIRAWQTHKLLLSFFEIMPVTCGNLRSGKAELTGVSEWDAFSMGICYGELLALENLTNGNEAV